MACDDVSCGGGIYSTYSNSIAKPSPLFQVLGVQLVKYDELACLIHGIHYINAKRTHDCYYWSNPHHIENAKRVPYDFETSPYPYLVVNIGSGVSILTVHSADQYKRISGTR